MLPDRKTQQLILETVAASYPDHPPFETFSKLVEIVGDGDKLVVNMIYLEGHGLIASGLRRTVDGQWMRDEAGFFLTHDGVDFLLDDGGLSAILNTVTVKFHDESLARVFKFIQESSLSPQDKSGYVAKLKELPADSTKHIVLKLIDLGLATGGKAALQLIRSSLGLE